MDIGTWIVVGAAAVAVVTAFWARRAIPRAAAGTVLALAGAGIGWGGMLIQRDPSIGEFAAAVGSLAFLIPVHVRIVLGPFGPQK